MSEIAFAEVLLDLGYDYGAIGGPRFSNTKIQVGNGYTQTNIDWDSPLGRWQIGDRSGDTALREAEAHYLRDFFWARKGSAQPFRYKDWADHRAVEELIGTGNGTRTVFQLKKTYGDEYGSTVRTITKPVADSFSISIEETTILSATLNSTTGQVTFTSPPPNGAKIYASFEFHIPVTFEQDTLDLRFAYYDADTDERFFDLGSLSVIEQR